VPDDPYRAPLPATPAPRRRRWLRVSIASAVGLLCGPPIGAGGAALLSVLDGGLEHYRGFVWVLLTLCGLCCTPFVVAGLTYQALGRPKNEALRFIAGAFVLAMLGAGAVALTLSVPRGHPPCFPRGSPSSMHATRTDHVQHPRRSCS
jgi:hypothetical protein